MSFFGGFSPMATVWNHEMSSKDINLVSLTGDLDGMRIGEKLLMTEILHRMNHGISWNIWKSYESCIKLSTPMLIGELTM